MATNPKKRTIRDSYAVWLSSPRVRCSHLPLPSLKHVLNYFCLKQIPFITVFPFGKQSTLPFHWYNFWELLIVFSALSFFLSFLLFRSTKKTNKMESILFYQMESILFVSWTNKTFSPSPPHSFFSRFLSFILRKHIFFSFPPLSFLIQADLCKYHPHKHPFLILFMFLRFTKKKCCVCFAIFCLFVFSPPFFVFRYLYSHTQKRKNTNDSATFLLFVFLFFFFFSFWI